MKFTTNFISSSPGGKAGVRQGDEIVVTTDPLSGYMLYGAIYKDGAPITIYWDGFNDGAADGILELKTWKWQLNKNKWQAMPLPKGTYTLMVRGCETANSPISGLWTDFVIF